MFLVKISCPGKIPWIRSPPSRTAAVGLPGILKVKRGINDGPTIELLALSAAIIASGSPFP